MNVKSLKADQAAFSHIMSPPNSAKESGSCLVMSVTYLGLVLILPTKFHPDLSALSVFQDPPPPNDPGSAQHLKQEI